MEARVATLESQLRQLELEWLEARDVLTRAVGRLSKRQALDRTDSQVPGALGGAFFRKRGA